MGFREEERDAKIALVWFLIGAAHGFLLIALGGGLIGSLAVFAALFAGWCGGRRAERAFGSNR